MPPSINRAFIEGNEGSATDGYVPDQGKSNSGVTIGHGVDLGWHTWQSLLPLTDITLVDMLRPYCGLHGQAAVDYLAAHPLRITQRQAALLDDLTWSQSVAVLVKAYNASGSISAFEDLPPEAQTVCMDVHYQYGDLATRCPKFWKTAVAQDWDGMEAELRNFGDRYPRRRLAEADYLSPLIEV